MEQTRLDRYKEQAQPIRDAINSRPLTDFYPLEKSSGSRLYICPICGSGTHAKRTGALSISHDGKRVTCFAGRCFGDHGQDTLGALRILNPGKTEAEIFSLCGYSLDEAQPIRSGGMKQPKPEGQQREEKPEERHDFKAEIASYAAALPGSEAETYLAGRGFTKETMQRFNLGYDAQRHCVTIPYNKNGSYYGRRSLIPEGQRPDGKGKFDKLPTYKAGKEPLFNASALYNSNVVFVTEGQLDAISIAQAGGAAVALNGTGAEKLISQLEKEPTKAAIVLCLDNDKPGREATETLSAKLEEMGVFCGNGAAGIMGEEQDPDAPEYRKDPNEVLQRDGTEALQRAVLDVATNARLQRQMLEQDAEEEAEAERQQHTGETMIDSFLKAVQTRRYEPMPTGITDIDNAIGGGFIRQQLILLGAAPGAGKTALAQWIFEGMAKRGTACVYLNLEMSREQILARSFSRIAARNGYRIKTTEILQGYRWTPEQRAAVLEAANEYAREIAPRMVYNPDNVTANLDSILHYIEQEAQREEAAGKPAPCVVLDYLHLISGDPREDAATLIKRAVSRLKDYAVKHNTIVFAITAHNRDSNSKGEVSMESGRDSSALEYSADLQLGLTYTECLKHKKKPEELEPEERRRVTILIVKGRFGGVGREVDLDFDGETMTYTQLEKTKPPRLY